jgi:CAAX protease family protein
VQDVSFIGAALLFASIAGTPRPEQFGLRRTSFWPAVGWIVLAFIGFYLVTLVWVAILGADPDDTKLPDELGVKDSTAAMLAVAFLVAVVAPVAEEFFFRGFFFTSLRAWKGLWPAAVITGLVFGGIHVGSAEAVFLAPLAFFGFALCLLYQRTGSLYPCMALHCLNNSLAFGVSQHWGWETPVLFVSALSLISLGALVVRATWTPAPAPAG